MSDPHAFFSSLSLQGPERPVETIVLLGLGDGAALRWALSTRAGQIVIVDPDPDHVTPADDPRVRRIHAVIGDTSGPVTYRSFNLPMLSGVLKPAPGLLELFPGLVEVATTEVDAVPPEDVVTQLHQPAPERSLLFVDLPGLSDSLLSRARALPFERLFVHGSAQPCFEDGHTLAQATAGLGAAGYRLLARDMGDPDFPWICLERDATDGPSEEQIRQLDDLTNDLEQLTAERDDMARQLDLEVSRCETELRQRDALCQSLQAQLEQAASHHEARLREADAQCARLQAQLKQAADENTRLRSALATAERGWRDEQETRQKLDEAFSRTEAQIDLLKSLFGVGGEQQ